MKKLFLIVIFLYSLVSYSQTYYGSPYGVDGLANLRVGYYPNTKIVYRFVADHTGNVEDIGIYVAMGTGYSAGTGGEIKISIQADDGTSNHYPTGVVLTSVTDNTPLVEAARRKYTFDSPVALTSGTMYHIVWENLAVDYLNNYVSADMNWIDNPPGIWEDLSPLTSNTNSAVLWSYRDVSYLLMSRYQPIYTLYYSDATESGIGYMGTGITFYTKEISGNNKVRTRIKPSSAVIPDYVWTRVYKVSGTDSLKITLEEADGDLIDTAKIAASAINTYMTWVGSEIAGDTLEIDSIYYLVLSAPAATSYKTYPIIDGGWTGALKYMFPDGYYQHTPDGTNWTTSPGSQGKLEFYFEADYPPPAVIPTVYTSLISSSSSKTATTGGSVTFDGGATVTARGVCWSTSVNPTISDSKTTNGTGTGIFNSWINTLLSNTTYHVRAYATNSAGTGYGEDITFTTSVFSTFVQNGKVVVRHDTILVIR